MRFLKASENCFSRWYGMQGVLFLMIPAPVIKYSLLNRSFRISRCGHFLLLVPVNRNTMRTLQFTFHIAVCIMSACVFIYLLLTLNLIFLCTWHTSKRITVEQTKAWYKSFVTLYLHKTLLQFEIKYLYVISRPLRNLFLFSFLIFFCFLIFMFFWKEINLFERKIPERHCKRTHEILKLNAVKRIYGMVVLKNNRVSLFILFIYIRVRPGGKTLVDRFPDYSWFLLLHRNQ